jgi:hypothetical protein
VSTVTGRSATRRGQIGESGGSLRKKERTVRRFFAADAAAWLATPTTSRKFAAGGCCFRFVGCIAQRGCTLLHWDAVLRLLCVYTVSITSVQRFHLMPKDLADQQRHQLQTILQQLSQGSHFLVVYYSPTQKHYLAVASQSWLPVLQSKELSRVLHSATQTIAYDDEDLKWCQQECSSLDTALQHISRDCLKSCVCHLNWKQIRKKARDNQALQHFQGTCAFFGEPQEGTRGAVLTGRHGQKPPVQTQPLLVNARVAWTKQTDRIPAHHVSFEDFLKKPVRKYTPNDSRAALGLILDYYDTDHFTNAEPSPALTTAYYDLAIRVKMDCHEKTLTLEEEDSVESDASETSEPSSCFGRKAWLALVNGVLFPIQTMKSTPFNLNSAAQHRNTASFRGRGGEDPWAVYADSADQPRPSGICSERTPQPSNKSNLNAFCVKHSHLLLSPDERSELQGEANVC